MYLSRLKAVVRPKLRRIRAIVQETVPRLTHLSPNDIIVASFPKSGNTLFRFIWVNVELGLADDNRILHFGELETTFNAEYESKKSGSYTFNHLPRIVKAHSERAHLPIGPRKVIYIIRNPGDVMVSYHKYMQNHEYERFRTMSLAEFIRDPQYGIAPWIRHTLSWHDAYDIAVHYDDLFVKPNETMMQVFSQLDISQPPQSVLEEAIEKSSFKNVRYLEDKFGHSESFSRNFRTKARFVRSGKSGEWRQNLSKTDIFYVNQQLKNAGLIEFQLTL